MGKPPKILVVTGSDECPCLIDNLRPLGEVVVASGMKEGLSRLQNGDIDVLFSAWNIQDGNWRDLLAGLRQQGNSVPAVVYYHCAGEADWMSVLQEGAFDLLAPPFDPYKLSVVLEHAVASQNCAKSAA